MSQNANKWEADVRRAVETHEFDFDPAAWTAMEQMLDGVGGGAAGTSPGAGAAWPARARKVLIVLLLGIGGLLWWYWPAEQAATPPPYQKETPPLPDTTQLTIEPAAPKEGLFMPDSPKPSGVPAPGREATAPLPPLSDREAPLLMLPLREEPLRPRWAAPPLLPTRAPALLELPDSPPPELKPLLPVPAKRRRNRKTLFPDVIEKY